MFICYSKYVELVTSGKEFRKVEVPLIENVEGKYLVSFYLMFISCEFVNLMPTLRNFCEIPPYSLFELNKSVTMCVFASNNSVTPKSVCST